MELIWILYYDGFMLLESIIFLVFIFVVYSVFVEPRIVQVQKLKFITSKNIKQSQKLLFISDIHVGYWDTITGMESKIKRLNLICKKENVQAVLIAGDIMDLDEKYLPRLKKYLSCIASLDIPVIAVTGNHDAQSQILSLASVEKILRKEGVVVLKNGSILLGGLQVVGIQDLLGEDNYKQTAKNWKDLETQKVVENLDWYKQIHKDDSLYIILLSHNPDAFYLPGEPRPDLVLAGHTHGGQMAFLDWFLALNLIPFSMRKFLPLGTFCTKSGLLKKQNTDILISRGFGSSGLPFRFLRRPQLHIIEIQKSS